MDTFTGRDGLISSSRDAAVDGSPWVVTSGSLFRSDDHGWTGHPDDGESAGDNGSAVFRMVSRQRGFVDVDVRMRLRVEDLGNTDRTPKQDFDGAHVLVRYQSEEQLYAVSVDRRDGTMIVKKKCAGGPSNGGRYFDLIPPVADRPIPVARWQLIEVTVRDLSNGSVEITGSRDGLELKAVDEGIGCAPLREPGGVGLRGDNAELRIDDVVVQPNSSPAGS